MGSRSNMHIELDKNMKLSVLDVAPSVVAIDSFSGINKLYSGSGTIIECHQMDGFYRGIILSSATLFVDSSTKKVAKDLEVHIHLRDGYTCKGQILKYERHFNSAFIAMESQTPLVVAKLSYLEDSLPFNPSGSISETCSDRYGIQSGDTLIAVSRCGTKLMAVGGRFSVERCNMDCDVLFRMQCSQNIDSGIGGPIISTTGDVIGLTFGGACCVPFLPINVAMTLWMRYEQNREMCLPEIGIKAANIYTANIEVLDKLNAAFPNVSGGVLVGKVMKLSSACNAGILPDDIIIECGGSSVRSLLHFFELAWGKPSESLNLVTIRPVKGASFNVLERLPVEVKISEKKKKLRTNSRKRLRRN